MRLALPCGAVRVLVVDDSVVVRQMVSRVVAGEPLLELAGVASNGHLALEKLERTRPDVVVLDLEMPEMDGLETLAAIRSRYPKLPVIIFSHLSSAGASATLEALALGATDFALKPSANGIGLAEQHVRDELVHRVMALFPQARTMVTPSPVHPSPSLASSRSSRSTPIAAIVVAVSTGGPNALAELVPALPHDLPVPMLIVQHMPPVFTNMLAQRLDRIAAISVCEAGHGDEVLPGRIYIAPGGRHMTVAGSQGHVRVELSDGPSENSCRPAADVLFRSAAEIFGAGTLAVVLTGMGCDGLRGAEAVRAAGGPVLAQCEATSVIASMPGAVAAAGLADAVVPLDQLASQLVRWTSRGRP